MLPGTRVGRRVLYISTATGQAHPGPRGSVYALLAWPGWHIHRSWAQERAWPVAVEMYRPRRLRDGEQTRLGEMGILRREELGIRVVLAAPPANHSFLGGRRPVQPRRRLLRIVSAEPARGRYAQMCITAAAACSGKASPEHAGKAPSSPVHSTQLDPGLALHSLAAKPGQGPSGDVIGPTEG